MMRPSYGDRSLVKRAPGPESTHMPIDITDVACFTSLFTLSGIRRDKGRQQCLAGIDAFQLTKELIQRQTLVTSPEGLQYKIHVSRRFSSFCDKITCQNTKTP